MITNNCEQCGVEFHARPRTKRFCSISCANRHNRGQRRTGPPRRKYCMNKDEPHLLTDDNVYEDKRGRRLCRACKRKYQREYEAARRAANNPRPRRDGPKKRGHRPKPVEWAPPPAPKPEQPPWRPPGFAPTPHIPGRKVAA